MTPAPDDDAPTLFGDDAPEPAAKATGGKGADAGPDAPAEPAPGSPDDLARPLAARLRPRTLAEISGQDHLLGPGCLLPRLLRNGAFSCLILYGPPGCGKTTLAEVIARETGSRFVRVNAVMSNVKEMREILETARRRPRDRTVLFVDEIHRFNKAQQDLLLPDVESGVVRLIGATTHNPGFYVIPPLLSRGHLLRLEPLRPDTIVATLKRALADEERGLGRRRLQADDAVWDFLATVADGDMRRGLNALETLAATVDDGARIDTEMAAAYARERQIRYDRDEDAHYDTVSAFIKSMRGCDPDAALYWLAKMLAGGEDARFIARRLVIFASEDVGMADPMALPLAAATFQACEFVGLPECEYNLAHCTTYLACAPKSNSATLALFAAKKALSSAPVQEVPIWLRDAHNATNRKMGQGDGYRYSHDFPENISGQDYLVRPLHLYTPKSAGFEARAAERLERWKSLKDALRNPQR